MLSTKELLIAKGLRPTPNRQVVLNCFTQSGQGLSHTDLVRQVGSAMDRVSVYRCLQDLEEAGLLHGLKDGKGIRIYLRPTEPEVSHVHPHFKCKKCQQISCLPELPASYLQCVNACEIDTIQFFIEGTCQHCRQK